MNARKKIVNIGMKKKTNPRSACFKRNEKKKKERKTETKIQLQNRKLKTIL